MDLGRVAVADAVDRRAAGVRTVVAGDDRRRREEAAPDPAKADPNSARLRRSGIVAALQFTAYAIGVP